MDPQGGAQLDCCSEGATPSLRLTEAEGFHGSRESAASSTIKAQVRKRTAAATPAAAPRRNKRPGDDKREAKPSSRPAVGAPTSRRAARSRASATVCQTPSSQPAWRPSHQTAPEQETACVSSRLLRLLMLKAERKPKRQQYSHCERCRTITAIPVYGPCDGAACDSCWVWQTRHENEQDRLGRGKTSLAASAWESESGGERGQLSVLAAAEC
jgi:hypothetical protein